MRARGIALAIGLAGCGSTLPPPAELVAARQAFGRASTARAGEVPLVELEQARQLLERAEQANARDPGSPVTRDLAYLALREAELAESAGRVISEQHEAARLGREAARVEARLERARRARRSATAAERARREEARRQARVAAGAKVQAVLDELRPIGEIVQQGDQIVLRIPEARVFSRYHEKLTKDGPALLGSVARSLLKLDQARFVVEGHTDAAGSEDRNRRLTLREADLVRSGLLAGGLPPQRIEAVGKGEAEPLADNNAAPSRNRRVEIWIEPVPSPDDEDTFSGLLAR